MTRKQKSKQQEEKVCTACSRSRSVKHFYSTQSKMFSDKLLPFCKDCLKSMVDLNNIQTLYDVLRTVDKPFLADVWKVCLQKDNPIGNFWRMLSSLPQYKELTWKDSRFEESSDEDEEEGLPDGEYIDPTVTSNKDKIVAPQVTEELYRKWGRQFKPSEILDFEEAYRNLESSFEIENTNQETYLKMACINQVKAMYAMAGNNAKEARDYMTMFDNVTKAANFQPAQNKKDLTQGINSFSEMVKKVEEAVDVIGILPRFRERPIDKADVVIWQFANYVRNLKGLEEAPYEEIWRWIDSRKKAYEDMAARIAELDKGDGGDDE